MKRHDRVFCARICRNSRLLPVCCTLRSTFAAHRSRASRSLASRRLAIALSAGYVSQSASLKHSIKRTRPYYVVGFFMSASGVVACLRFRYPLCRSFSPVRYFVFAVSRIAVCSFGPVGRSAGRIAMGCGDGCNAASDERVPIEPCTAAQGAFRQTAIRVRRPSAGRSRHPCGPRQTCLHGKRKAAPASHGDRSVKS